MTRATVEQETLRFRPPHWWHITPNLITVSLYTATIIGGYFVMLRLSIRVRILCRQERRQGNTDPLLKLCPTCSAKISVSKRFAFGHPSTSLLLVTHDLTKMPRTEKLKIKLFLSKLWYHIFEINCVDLQYFFPDWMKLSNPYCSIEKNFLRCTKYLTARL